ncbi:MAG TPA: hypothetical protein VFZ09_33990 [Archangium sp.]|uniref:TRAFAC clade GTPase domain-containing protein n=1 Tax=Archangium sp. TaxID=1872627 RepID=UPI002E36C8DC|nr:hypothetical protein [Archangium sp.]HEX5751285.1 hypothetical protein [Archangium sp.]
MALPPALQPPRCNNPDCTLPEGGRCARLAEFPNPLADCPDLARTTTAPEPPRETASLSAPWSGRHLDSVEVERLLSRTPARLIAVLGPYNAGKTCLLTSFFLQLANGQRASFPYRFASSLTLHSFRELMERASQWTGESAEDIVQHTTVGADVLRPSSFLHVGLRPQDFRDERHIDLLLTDIPGEWVKDWTGRVDDVSGRRMAFIQRCDAFVVLADASALMGAAGGRTDNETSLLVRRIQEMTRDMRPRPPLALVLSKFDRVIHSVLPPAPEKRTERTGWGELSNRLRRTWLALEDARREQMPFSIFPVSAFPHRMAQGQPVGVMDPFTYAMEHADRRAHRKPLHTLPPEEARGFATLRRWRDEP